MASLAAGEVEGAKKYRKLKNSIVTVPCLISIRKIWCQNITQIVHILALYLSNLLL